VTVVVEPTVHVATYGRDRPGLEETRPLSSRGERVRIVCAPLTDVEGILIRTKPNKGIIVLCVALLQRSVAVEIDCTVVAPA
jgi:transcription antitermination factor NusG